MATAHETVSVGTTPTQLLTAADAFDYSGAGTKRTVLITPSADIFIGTSAVTVTNYGVKVAANTTLSLDLYAGDTLYAVTAVTATVQVLHLGL